MQLQLLLYTLQRRFMLFLVQIKIHQSLNWTKIIRRHLQCLFKGFACFDSPTQLKVNISAAKDRLRTQGEKARISLQHPQGLLRASLKQKGVGEKFIPMGQPRLFLKQPFQGN